MESRRLIFRGDLIVGLLVFLSLVVLLNTKLLQNCLGWRRANWHRRNFPTLPLNLCAPLVNMSIWNGPWEALGPSQHPGPYQPVQAGCAVGLANDTFNPSLLGRHVNHLESIIYGNTEKLTEDMRQVLEHLEEVTDRLAGFETIAGRSSDQADRAQQLAVQLLRQQNRHASTMTQGSAALEQQLGEVADRLEVKMERLTNRTAEFAIFTNLVDARLTEQAQSLTAMSEGLMRLETRLEDWQFAPSSISAQAGPHFAPKSAYLRPRPPPPVSSFSPSSPSPPPSHLSPPCCHHEQHSPIPRPPPPGCGPGGLDPPQLSLADCVGDLPSEEP